MKTQSGLGSKPGQLYHVAVGESKNAAERPERTIGAVRSEKTWRTMTQVANEDSVLIHRDRKVAEKVNAVTTPKLQLSYRTVSRRKT